ncbi:MAG: ABC transporter ATP-binding protein [Chloroflexi bacterium]|nr:ABC transporter ATP-binding protein [Chloroflexota bacterium]
MSNSKTEQVEYPITWGRVLAIFQPYMRTLVSIAVISVGLSVLTSSSQIALTPLAEIVLSGEPAAEPVEGGFSECSIGLDEIGGCILGAASAITGTTDRWRLLVTVSVLYLLVAISSQAAGFGANAWAQKVRQTMIRDISTNLFAHVTRLPLAFFDRHQIGWIQSRIVYDIEKGTELLTDFLLHGIANIIISLIYAGLLIATDFQLALIAGVAGSVHLFLSNRLGQWIKRTIRDDYGAVAQTSAYIQERLGAIREIKSLAAEAIERAAIFEVLKRRAQAGLSHSIAQRIEIPIRWSVNRVVIVVVMLAGAWRVLNGSLSVEGFALFLVFAQSLIGPLSTLARMLVQLAGLRASMEQALYLIDQPQESSGKVSLRDHPFTDRIAFHDVSFAYNPDVPVLKNISFTINKGEMVALVGRSGAGKTTLVDLLLRLYQPTSGHIEMDGTPIQEFDLGEYRRQFGVVSQNSTLVDDTVAANITYARSHLSQVAVERAARIANADEFIRELLPMGYETRLGERGVLLSGGQQQRIAIARAVVSSPPLLVLDEATSALDSESERKVQDAINEVVKGCTAVVIAHRLSTVRRADKIIVLRNGEIVEEGSHDSLLAQGGEYRYLYEQQFAEDAVLESATD